jgi:two-component system NtrC family sensor kinase
LEEEILTDIKGNLQKINHHGNRASSIVKGMLEHSRASSGKKELTDINALADEYLRLSYHGLRAKDKTFNVALVTDYDTNVPKVEVIPQDIGRVLLNLINNAFQAVHEKSLMLVEEGGRSRGRVITKDGDGLEPEVLDGGILQDEASSVLQETSEGALASGTEDYKPMVSITTKLTANGQLLIVIEDNGSGIPEEIKDKIFQPFFTTKDTGKGIGLGLSLAYDIVMTHGGKITLGSKLTNGTEFIVLLPVK